MRGSSVVHFTCFLVSLLWSVSSVRSGQQVPDEQRLYEVIMHEYQKSVRPVINASEVLIVKFALRLNQIVGLDERQQVLTTNVFIDQEWTDESLIWRPSDFNGIKSLRVAGNTVWLPDTFMFNNADDGSTGFMKGTFVQIHSNGTVLWPVPVKLKSSCKVDITYFPFDDQECILRFGSWIYSGLWVDYVTKFNNTPIDMGYYVNNSEWDLLSVTLQKNIRQYACCPEPHPDLTFILHIRRRTFYYIFNIIVPCIMLSILTLLTFWLPPTSGEKVTLGLNVFLAFSMFMLLVAEQVPATSEAVPLIGIYLCVVMTMTSASVIMAVIVINVYNRGMKMRRAPAWLRVLALSWVSKVLRLKHNIELIARRVVLDTHLYDIKKHSDYSSQIRKTYSKFDVSKPYNSPIFTRHNNNSEGYQPARSALRYRQNTSDDTEHQKTEHEPGIWRHQEDPAHQRVETEYNFQGCGETALNFNTSPAATMCQNIQGFPHLPSVRYQNACQSLSSAYQTACQTQSDQCQNLCQSQYACQQTDLCQSTYQLHSHQQPQHQHLASSRPQEETEDKHAESESQKATPPLKNMIIAEWQSIASVVDRVLFWFYVIVTCTAYIIILIIVPAQHVKDERRGVFMGMQPPVLAA